MKTEKIYVCDQCGKPVIFVPYKSMIILKCPTHDMLGYASQPQKLDGAIDYALGIGTIRLKEVSHEDS